MATVSSREKAAQAWCKPTTSHKVMDPELADAFAEVLDEIWSQPTKRAARSARDAPLPMETVTPMADKEAPWAGVDRLRAELINCLGALCPTNDVVKLAKVRDAIDHLIMERLEYSGKPTVTESFVLKAIEELRVVELEIGVPSKALQLLGCSQISAGEKP